MKKTKAVSLLLSLSLVMSLAMPGTFAMPTYAATDTTDTSSGMALDKTVKNNHNGTYTITLDAYATGSTTITTVTEDVPSDIILVLDQSGSMKNSMTGGSYGYSRYLDKSNENYYNASNNLYYRSGDDYFPVTVNRETVGYGDYVEISQNTNNQTYYYLHQSNTLYRKNGSALEEVDVRRDATWYGPIEVAEYTYIFADNYQYVSNGNHTVPDFGGRGPLYYYSSSVANYTYIYTYTDKNGDEVSIGTSSGNSTQPEFDFYERYTISSRGDAIKAATTTFIDAVAEKAAGLDGDLNTADDNIKHRIAVVGFASKSGYGDNTELLSIKGSNSGSVGVAYDNITRQNQLDVLKKMYAADGQYWVRAAIDALTANGATRIDLGLEMAEDILRENPVEDNEKRNRVVIVFTDGAPTDNDGFEKDVAKNANTIATRIKNELGATIYSVGVFEGANANDEGKEPEKDLGNDSKNLAAACNWFMQNISSNNGKHEPDTLSYYLSAADAETLNSIFKQMSQDVASGGSHITTLNKETVIKDVMSQYFQLPAGATKDSIRLKTYKYNGTESNGKVNWIDNGAAEGIEATITGNDQVQVKGFDFSANWCGIEKKVDGTETPHGNKLEISFEVVPKSDFLGGNEVPTNSYAAVYKDSEDAKKDTNRLFEFPKPETDVEIKNITVNVPDKDVYLLDSVSVSKDNLNGTAYVGGENGVSLDLSQANFGLEKWQYDFVNINVNITDGNKENITDDSDYTVSVSIEPTVKEGAAETKTGTGTGKIKVYKPYLTFKDGEAWYGDNVPAATELNSNLVETKWYHVDGENKEDANFTTMGEAPNLTLSYHLDASNDKVINTKEDVPVDVSVTLKDTNVSDHTTFLHNDCTGKTCTLPENYEFLLHIKTCQLTITKNGGAAGEPYVFTVKRNGEKYSEVTIVENGSATIYELPVGTYTIAEDTGWSWRYTPSYEPESVTLAASTPENQLAYTGEITCTNEKIKDKDKWLNGFSDVVTNIFGKSHTQKGGEK